jgi:CheY-like chemotaxis protein
VHERDVDEMKRALVLDDERVRHEAFDAFLSGDYSIEHAWTYHEAIAMLKNEQFDIAYLDHDLNDFKGVSSMGSGTYGSRELTGADVTRFIARELEPTLRPKKVVVHSWNPDGARAMIAMLRDVGISCTYEPFAEPSPRNF